MLLMLLVTSALFCILVPDGFTLSSTIRPIASAAVFGFSNIRLAFGTSYFFPNAEFDPFTHTWSLGVEEQFYAIFPIVYFLLASHRTANATIIVLLSLCVGSFAYGCYEPDMAFNLGFYSSPARFWEIGSGVLLFAFFARSGGIQQRPLPELRFLTSIGALLIAIAFLQHSANLSCPRCADPRCRCA
jgi:peptidoglycan/LPS O-acetylase OafA/YrhL